MIKKILFFSFLAVLAWPGISSADGALGTISANSTTSISASATTLRYIDFPGFSGTIAYVYVGCSGTYYPVFGSLWAEKECSSLTLKNTNLTSSYTYSVIYGTTTELGLLEKISNATSGGASIPDPVRVIAYNAVNATSASGTSALIVQQWTYGELFNAFILVIFLILVIFKMVFCFFFPSRVEIRRESDL